MNPSKHKRSALEFIAITALLMACTAFSIDAVLPAFNTLSSYFNLQDPNAIQLTVQIIFVGLAIGQLIFGPLSDVIGRKPTVYFGFIFFIAGTFLASEATDYKWFLLGRGLQGFGLSANRTIALAMIRDLYHGAEMARIMSFIMAIFIIVPIIAPSYGQLVLKWGDWKMIFYSLFIMGLWVLLWFGFRQSETLDKSKRTVPKWDYYVKVLKEIITNGQALMGTIAQGLIMGCFLAFLSTSPQIFSKQFDYEEEFPLIFAAMALSVGVLAFINGFMVKRFGIFKVIKVALFIFAGITVLFSLYLWLNGSITFVPALIFFIVSLGSTGLLTSNYNALAMEPMGSHAGVGATFVGTISMLISVGLGNTLGGWYQGGLEPLIYGYSAVGLILILLTFLLQIRKS